jgi:UDP-N-acetylmuramate dehydrogenase
MSGVGGASGVGGQKDVGGATSGASARATGAKTSLRLPPELFRLPEVEARPMLPIANLTTFRIGGPADLALLPQSRAGLEAAVVAVRRAGLPLLTIGAGSNLLASEAGFHGVAIKIASGLMPIRIEGERIIADAGRTLPELMRRARKAALSGLEFAGGIPGSLGGSLKMNAGAWQHEMSEVADWVLGVNESGVIVHYRRHEIHWHYRSARFPEPIVILEAGLHLTPDDPNAIAEREDAWHDSRRRTQPLGEPSAGCVFKNPDQDYASRLIDSAGLKGERVGGAVVSPVHANFIVNEGGATADEVMRLIDTVRERVFRVHGVRLELEVQLVGLTSEGG